MSVTKPEIDTLLDKTENNPFLLCTIASKRACDINNMLTCVGRYVPNADDEWGVSSRMQGLWGTVRVMRVMSSEPRGGLLGALDGWRGLVLQSFDPSSSEARAVLAGCICGSRAAIRADGLDDVFAACGLSHLVAVSGGHLVIVCVTVGLLLERMRLRPVVRGTMVSLILTICDVGG